MFKSKVSIFELL